VLGISVLNGRCLPVITNVFMLSLLFDGTLSEITFAGTCMDDLASAPSPPRPSAAVNQRKQIMATPNPLPEASGSSSSPHRHSPAPADHMNIDGSPIQIMRPRNGPRARFSMFDQAPDVIVVDSGSEEDEVQVVESLRHRKRQRRQPPSPRTAPEIISLVDDDDDIEISAAHTASSSQPLRELFSTLGVGPVLTYLQQLEPDFSHLPHHLRITAGLLRCHECLGT